MSYEAWRISYQSSEQAARAAYEECVLLSSDLATAEQDSRQKQARIERLESALRLIADTYPVDAALDPQRAVRVARDALEESK